MFFELFAAFFKIGLFSFGGGYAMLPLIQAEVVDCPSRVWLTLTEFTDIVAISQMTPGSISINCATYVGYVVSGNVLGSLLATIGVCLPSLIIMTLLSKFYLYFRKNKYFSAVVKAVEPAVIGLISAAAIALMNGDNFIDIHSLIIFVVVVLGALKELDPILLMIASAIYGIIIY